MKFTKTALAIAAIVSSVGAAAQTANVTLYGRVSTNIESVTFKGPTSSVRLNSVENISSRFGFRGSESLGGGMNAIFQLESGFASDTGAGGTSGGVAQLFGREAWVGLNGGFGEVKIGYGLTPFDDVLGWAHHQGANSWENRNNGVSGGAGFAKQNLFNNYVNASGCTSSAFDARYGNSISYKTPTIAGGLTLRTQYALLGEASSNSCNAWDTALLYSAGPVRFGLAYAMHKRFTGIGGLTAVGTTLLTPGTPSYDQNAIRAYGSFNAGPVLIDATYETASYKLATTRKYKYWEIGAIAPVGAWTLGAQYSQRDNGLAYAYTVTPTGPAFAVTAAGLTTANWANGGGKHFSLTADYALSKRTAIRSYYTQLKNETGVKINAISTGLWHSF